MKKFHGISISVASIFLLLPTVASAASEHNCRKTDAVTEIEVAKKPRECISGNPLFIARDGSRWGLPGPGEFVQKSQFDVNGASSVQTLVHQIDGTIEYATGTSASANPSISIENYLASTPQQTAASGILGCDNSNYVSLGRKWDAPMPWYYNVAGETSSLAKARINSSFATWQNGFGRCGIDAPATFTYKYLGGTSLSPNISSTDCELTSDGRSVVGWNFLGPNILGITCTRGKIAAQWIIGEADIVFSVDGSGFGWYYPGQSTPCQQNQNFQYTATHEIGHALGLGHSADGSGQIMSRFVPAPSCTDAILNRLGNGDLAGLSSLY